MSNGIDSHLPDDPPTQAFLFVVLFLVVLPVVVILATMAPYVLMAAIGVGFLAWLLHQTGVIGDSEGEVAGETDPLKTLQNRYARGEIDEAEFERRLGLLVETEGLDLADASDDAEAILEREPGR